MEIHDRLFIIKNGYKKRHLKPKKKFFGILSKFLWEDIFQDYLFKLVVAKKIDISLELFAY